MYIYEVLKATQKHVLVQLFLFKYTFGLTKSSFALPEASFALHILSVAYAYN